MSFFNAFTSKPNIPLSLASYILSRVASAYLGNTQRLKHSLSRDATTQKCIHLDVEARTRTLLDRFQYNMQTRSSDIPKIKGRDVHKAIEPQRLSV